jgi:hypothetical protein
VPILNATTVRISQESYGEANQALRIFRRVPNETFVLIQNLSYAGPGLLLPYNFNPNYNPVEVAKNLNLI